jgi:hypothetical protein
MKNTLKIFLLLALAVTNLSYSQNGIGIGTTSPHSSSILEISASSKGLLIPRMTTIERIAIATPATGLQVYDTTTNTTWSYNAEKWIETTSKWTNDVTNTAVTLTTLSNGTSPRTTGTEFIVKDNGNVGIGTIAPTEKLEVAGAIKVGSASAIPTAGTIRFNTTTNKFEGFDGAAWVEFH